MFSVKIYDSGELAQAPLTLFGVISKILQSGRSNKIILNRDFKCSDCLWYPAGADVLQQSSEVNVLEYLLEECHKIVSS